MYPIFSRKLHAGQHIMHATSRACTNDAAQTYSRAARANTARGRRIVRVRPPNHRGVRFVEGSFSCRLCVWSPSFVVFSRPSLFSFVHNLLFIVAVSELFLL